MPPRFPALLVGLLLVAVQLGWAKHFELYSDLTDERWILEDHKALVPISCPAGDCSQVLRDKPKHKIGKRSVIQIDTMKDYIKFILRGNKTRDDDRNIDPFTVKNITLGSKPSFFPAL